MMYIALQLKLAYEYPDLCIISTSVGWRRLWNNVLDQCHSVIITLKHLIRVITYSTQLSSICPKCDVSELHTSLLDHIICQHIRSKATWDTLIQSLINLDSLALTNLCVFHYFNCCIRSELSSVFNGPEFRYKFQVDRHSVNVLNVPKYPPNAIFRNAYINVQRANVTGSINWHNTQLWPPM